MRRRAAIASILCAWIFSFPLSGDTFALRGLGKGDRVPDLTFVGITAESGKLSSFSGEKGLVVIYWATWSSRSPEILAFAEKELRRYEEHGVKLLAINADHQEMRREEIEAVKGKATEMALSI
jgi:peroxiredoxin